jgi:hypothetical protein
MLFDGFNVSRYMQSRMPSQSEGVFSSQSRLRSDVRGFGFGSVVSGIYNQYIQDANSRRLGAGQECLVAPCGIFDGLAELFNIPTNLEDSMAYNQNSMQSSSYSDPYMNHDGHQTYFSGESSSYSSFHEYSSGVHHITQPYQPQPYPPVVFQPYRAFSEAHTRTVGTRTVNLVNNWQVSEKNCTLNCIMMITGASYFTVRKLASKLAGFDGSEGLGFKDASRVLDRLGVENRLHSNTGDLDVKRKSFPDLAMVVVDCGGKPHAVVCIYDGEFTIFDAHHPWPRKPSDYEFLSDYSYLEICTE